MAITYSSAGSGAQTNTSTSPDNILTLTCPATVDSGDILIAHILRRSQSGTFPTPPSGWTLLSGPDSVGSSTGHSWIYGRIADGTEGGTSLEWGSLPNTILRAGRIYRFVGRVSGSITDCVLGFTHTFYSSDTVVPDEDVTTTGTDSLAINIVTVADNNTINAFAGQTGGTWVEAVAEYLPNLSTGGTLQLQTAAMASPGTIGGGSVTMSAADPFGVTGFYIRDQVPATGGTATPGQLDATIDLPAATATAGGATAPGQVDVAVDLPAPTFAGGAATSPQPIDVSILMDTPIIDVTVTPAVLDVAVDLPAPSTSAASGATATPATVDLLLDLPAPTTSAGAATAPAVLSLAIDLPAPSFAGGATGSPAVLDLVLDAPSPTATAGATAAPSVLDVLLDLLAPTLAGSATATPGVIDVTIDLGAVTVTTGATAAPAVLGLVIDFPAITRDDGSTRPRIRVRAGADPWVVTHSTDRLLTGSAVTVRYRATGQD